MTKNVPAFPDLRQEVEKAGTADSLYRSAVERFPHRMLIHALDGAGELRMTYEESARQITALSLHLRELRFAPGDRIICYLDQELPSVWFFLACTHLGVLPVPLSPVFSARTVEQLAGKLGARAVFTVPETAPRLANSGLQILSLLTGTTIKGVVQLNMQPVTDTHKGLNVLQELARGHHPDDACYIQPTSGSTGQPKLVIRSHRAWLRGISRVLWIPPEDEPPQRMLMITPLTHGNGHNLLASTLYLAAELAIPDGVGTAARLDEIRRLDPTYLHLVPRMLRELYRQHHESGADPEDRLFGPGTKSMYISGAAPDPALLRILSRQGIDIIPGYGTSEAGPISLGKPGAWREGYVGPTLPDIEIKLAPDGELLVRSSGRMTGYYGDEELTRAAFDEEGFSKTGDYAEMSADGYLRLIGRKKDVFNTYDGSNIYPQPIEERIEGFPWVRQAVLVGDQRPYLVALIVLRDHFGSAANDDGFLSEAVHRQLYVRAQTDLKWLNQELESNERVRAFALFGKSFSNELYNVMDEIKVKRNRQEIEVVYRKRIDALYASPPGTVPDRPTYGNQTNS